MSCFIVPLVQAIATSAYRKANSGKVAASKAPLMHNLPALEKMLWGGSIMLIVDHIINGELIWRFPFFTALDQVGGGAVMLREMLTVGVPMSLVLTAVWAVWAFVRKPSLT
jgi:hypothetical protein